MADIFVSHSAKDNDVAAAISERIRHDRPTWSLFYDKDNIRAGQRWQERLREELQSCRVVLALLSRNWLGSRWCFTEAVSATFRGKDVVGIEIEDLNSEDLVDAPPILHERQRVRLRAGDNRAWQEILEALDRSGLDPDEFFPTPPNVGPYPGLVAFDEKDAGVFFGRKQEITEYLGILDTLRGPDRAQVLVVSGASGSGKSSLLRAGLIPRLRRKPDWIVITPFEVAREPVRNLLDQLKEALVEFRVPESGLDLPNPPDDRRTLAHLLDETLRRLERARTPAWVLLPLDQAEALVAGDTQTSAAAKLLLEALAEVLARRTRRVVVAATIRTEFVPCLETVFAGTEVRLRQAPLSAIGSLAEIIEKPADRSGIELEPGLSVQIIHDVQTADALPLLAYTLKALNDRDGADRRLTLDGYRSLGGVQGAIAAKLELVLSDPEPTAEEVRGLRRAFTSTRGLVRVDEGAIVGERLLRRVVPRASLPPSADRVIGRLVDAGLLVTKDNTIELAHERLIDDWPKLPLRTWLAQDADDRRLIDRLRQFFVYDATLPDGLLAQAEDLLQRDPELGEEGPAIAQLVRRTRRRKVIRLGGALLVFFVVAISAVIAAWQANVAQSQRDKARTQLLAMEASRANAQAGTPDDVGLAGALALESIWLARKGNRPAEADAIEAARSALIHLPLEALLQRSQVSSLAVLADGRLASGGYDGMIRLWPGPRTGEPVVLSNGSPVLSLTVLADGRPASGGQDGNIRLWPKEGSGEPAVVFSHGSPVLSLAVLADGRLASGGDDGNIKIWPKDRTGEPVVLTHGSKPVLSLVGLVDGRLASGGEDGNIRLWTKGGAGEPVVLSHGSPVLSMTALPDGRLASGGIDGNIKLWPKDGTGEPVTVRQGNPIMSLAVLEDGRLASGGQDGNIRLWPGEVAGEPLVLSHGGPVLSLTALRDGRLASGGLDGKIKLWPKDGTGEPMVLLHDSLVLSLAVLPDGRLASGGLDGDIKLWPKDGRGEPAVLSHGKPVRVLAMPADGRLVSAGDDSKIRVWPRGGTGAPLVLSHDSPVTSLAVLTDGRLASGGVDGNIRLWPKEGTDSPLVLSHGGQVLSLTVLADGRLASGGVDGSIKFWPKGDTGEPVVRYHGSPVLSLGLLADGRLASGGADGNIKLWPKGTGEPAVLSHGSPVQSLTVVADGRLASAGDDENGTVKLWNTNGAGEPVVLSHGGPVFSLAVLPDGRLASGGADGNIKLWLVDEHQMIAALCLRAGHNLTKDEWARDIGSDTPWQPSCRDLPSNWQTPTP